MNPYSRQRGPYNKLYSFHKEYVDDGRNGHSSSSSASSSAYEYRARREDSGKDHNSSRREHEHRVRDRDDKEDRDGDKDRHYKRAREAYDTASHYTPAPYHNPYDAYSHTFKSLTEELKRYKDEVEHLHRLVDEGRAENAKLKREISSLEEEVSAKKQQIKDERLQHEDLFKENQYVISKLEEEAYRLRMAVAAVGPARMVMPTIPPLGIPPLTPLFPQKQTLSLDVKQDIVRCAERCLWISRTTVPSDELSRAFGHSKVECIFIDPTTTCAFVIFHNAELASEAVSAVRSGILSKYGVSKLLTNLVNNVIWVGNLWVDEETLRALCDTCGVVDSVRMLDKNCAFVTYRDTISAVTACCEIDGTPLASSPIVVNFKGYNYAPVRPEKDKEATSSFPLALPVCNVLYVGDLDVTMPREEITSVFGTYGNVQDVWTPRDGGYAFVTFETLEEAVVAKYHLQGKKMAGRAMRINYRKHVSPHEPPTDTHSESLIVKTKPKCEEAELRKVVGKYGKISFVERSRGDDWIVAMNTPEEAIVTKSHLNSRNIDGIHLSIDYLLPKKESTEDNELDLNMKQET